MTTMTTLLRAALALALLVFPSGVTVGAEKQTKILLIGKDPDHAYGTHMYLHTCGVLAKCLELTPGMQTVVSNGWPKDGKVREGIKTIVVYTSPAAELLLEGPHRTQVDKMMNNGVGLVTIH